MFDYQFSKLTLQFILLTRNVLPLQFCRLQLNQTTGLLAAWFTLAPEVQGRPQQNTQNVNKSDCFVFIQNVSFKAILSLRGRCQPGVYLKKLI